MSKVFRYCRYCLVKLKFVNAGNSIMISWTLLYSSGPKTVISLERFLLSKKQERCLSPETANCFLFPRL